MASNYDETTTIDTVVSDLASWVKDKVIVVTGVSPGGLGAYFVQAVARAKPGMIILAGRSAERLDRTAETVKNECPDVPTRNVVLDLASFDSVRGAAKIIEGWVDVPAIDRLVNNAGVMGVDYSKTVDGIEQHLQSNHLGHFLFTNLLMPKLLASDGGARVVNVSSEGHTIGHVRYYDWNFHDGESYNRWTAYGQSKSAQLLFALELAHRFGKHGLQAFAIHPAVCKTNLSLSLKPEHFQDLNHIWKSLGQPQGWRKMNYVSSDQAVANHAFVTFSPRFNDTSINGAYVERFEVKDADAIPSWAIGDREARKCWELSEKLVGQSFGGPGQ